MKSILFDLPEKKLKSEKFDENQKIEFRNSLNNCKYAQLKYNKTDITDITIKKKIDFSSNLEGFNVSEDDSDSAPIKSYDKIETYPKFPKQFTDLDNKENFHEVEKLIDEKEPCKSPVKYLLNVQNLSDMDNKLVEEADKKLLAKLKVAKDIKKTPKDTLKDQIDKMRVHQKLMMESFQIEKPKATPAASQIEFRDENHKSIEEIKTPEKITDLAKQPPKLIIQPPQINQDQHEIDLKALKNIEQHFINISSNLKSIQSKCDTSEYRDLLISSNSQIIQSYLNDIGKILTIIQTPTKQKIDLDSLNQMNEKYSKLSKNLEDKINNQLHDLNQHKIKEKLEKLQKEKELAERQKVFNEELNKYQIKFNEMKTFLGDLIEKRNKQFELIETLKNSELFNDSNELFNKINEEIFELNNFVNQNLTKFKEIKISTLKENECDKIFKDLKDFLVKCINNGEKLDKQEKNLEERTIMVKKRLDDQTAKLKADEAKLKAEEEARRKAIEAAEYLKAQEKLNKKNLVKKVDDIDKNGISHETFDFYIKNRDYYENMRNETEEAFKDKNLKIYKFDLQKAINFPLNSLLDDKNSEENRRNFIEKIKTLCRLLTGQTCAITSTLTVNPMKHPRAIDYSLVYLAKKLVEKSEETVASRPEFASQYAQVAIQVMNHNPKFENLLLAQINEKCPLSLPYYKQKQNGQTDEQYFESLGYKITDGKVEEEVHYYKRLSGMMHFYFTTLLMSTNKITSNRESFFNNGIGKLWRWIAEILNMTPRPSITAEVLSIFFKCCGHQMQLTYRNQFVKIIRVCSTDFLDLIKSIPNEQQSGASIGRLENIIDEFKKNKRFPEWKLA